MKILEFGDTGKRNIILIHGFQSPWQVWNKYIEYYKDSFHIIVPIMSGHNPDTKEDFISFTSDAKEIEDYILKRYGNNIYAIFGMSMGGVLTATLWQNGRLSFENVIFDGSPLVSENSFVKNFTLNFYIDVTHKSQKRDTKTLNNAKKICPEEYMEQFITVLDNMSDLTIRNSINCIADFKLSNSINTTSTEIYYFHGTTFNEMLAKKSAKYIKKHYPSAKIKSFKGKSHCENSLFNQEIMISELDRIFDEKYVNCK